MYLDFVFWKKLALEALEKETNPKMGTIFKSLEKSQPKARIHVAPEVLDEISTACEAFS